MSRVNLQFMNSLCFSINLMSSIHLKKRFKPNTNMLHNTMARMPALIQNITISDFAIGVFISVYTLQVSTRDTG